MSASTSCRGSKPKHSKTVVTISMMVHSSDDESNFDLDCSPWLPFEAIHNDTPRSIALTCIEHCQRCKVGNTIHYRVLPLDVVVHDAYFMEVLKHPLTSRCTFSMQYSSYPCKELGHISMRPSMDRKTQPTLQKPLGYLNITYTPEDAYTRDEQSWARMLQGKSKTATSIEAGVITKE